MVASYVRSLDQTLIMSICFYVVDINFFYAGVDDNGKKSNIYLLLLFLFFFCYQYEGFIIFMLMMKLMTIRYYFVFIYHLLRISPLVY